MSKGELVVDTIPTLESYENKTFFTVDGCPAQLDEVSNLTESEFESDHPPFVATVSLFIARIGEAIVSDITLCFEFGTEEELRNLLDTISRGYCSSEDIIDWCANSTDDPEKFKNELLMENALFIPES